MQPLARRSIAKHGGKTLHTQQGCSKVLNAIIHRLHETSAPDGFTSGRSPLRRGAAAPPAAAASASAPAPAAAIPEQPFGSAPQSPSWHQQHPQPHSQEQAGAPEPNLAWSPPVGRAGLYDAEGRLALKSLTLAELEAWCAAEGEPHPANRALQLWRWMYADPPAGSWIRSLEETLGRQNGFSAKFIEKVGPRVTLDGGLRLSQVVRASDGTRKLVFQVTGGEAAGGTVETVLIPIVRQQGLRDRLTICVSSQVGCAMNCQFCYTGRMGLLGNLSTAQIVEQVVEARRFLAEEGDRTQLTNLVFMGMGEPLHNTESVLAAAEVVGHYMGLHISHNKMTISTVGLVPELRQVAARSRAQIALSLHATTDEVRDWIVPVNRRYDLATLTAALEELFPKEELLPEQPQPQRATAGASGSSRPEEEDEEEEEEGTSATRREGRWLPPLGSAAEAQAGVECGASAGDGGSASGREGEGSEEGGNDDGAAGNVGSSSRSTSGSTSASTSGRSGNGGGGGGSGGGGGGRSLLVEYTMLHGINDTLEDAERLFQLLSRVKCKVNLIVFNPHAGTRFQASRPEAVSAFRSLLVQRGMVCTIRDSRGDDEMAACGQLGNVGLAFRPSPILDAPERFRPFLLPAQVPAASKAKAGEQPAAVANHTA